jgi:hypothetical protein
MVTGLKKVFSLTIFLLTFLSLVAVGAAAGEKDFVRLIYTGNINGYIRPCG